jgi:tripartite-type tricarboxylate transporter receptor subunit TctC
MFRRIAAGWLSIGLVAATAHAQDFPTRTLTMIVPFAAGGAADVTGRILAEGIGRQLGQNVIVENVSGAGGTIGATRGKNAPADGYTISLGHMGTHAAAPALYPRLGYDPRKDFEYLGLIAKSPIILFARKTLPAKTLTDFIAYAKKEGPKLKNGHSGVGSISHITCALFDQLVDIKPTSVPYRGVGPMMNDMLGDNVDYGCDLVAALSPQVKSGNIMGLAVAAPQRAAAVPDVPTTVEAGLPDFQADAWTALFVPKGTPEPALAKLRAATEKALDDPAVRDRLTSLGASIPVPEERGPAYLQQLVTKEVSRWAKVIEKAGITAQ